MPIRRKEGRQRALTAGLIFPIAAVPVALIFYFGVLRSPNSSLTSSPRLGFHRHHDRDSLDIIYGCLSTLAICVISVVHFPIFEDEPHAKSARWPVFSKVWNLLLFKIFTWTFCSLLMPEIITACACMEYIQAINDVAYMRKTKGYSEGQHKWTKKQAFFALMGGFKLKNGPLISSGRQLAEKIDGSAGQQQKLLLDQLNLQILKGDVRDKSKRNSLAKLFSVFQLFRFGVSILSRLVAKQPLSPLERITTAYVVCATMTYYFWMKKPYDVEAVIYLDRVSSYWPRDIGASSAAFVICSLSSAKRPERGFRAAEYQ